MNQSTENDGLDAQLEKARKTSTTWAAVAAGCAVLAVGTFFAGVVPATVALALGSVVSVWRYLGAADRVQHLEHRVEAREGTGAGRFWAGK